MKKSAQIQMKSEASLQPQELRAYEQEVSRRAYELWEAGGCQHGNHVSHWLEAEREVQARRLQKGDQRDREKN